MKVLLFLSLMVTVSAWSKTTINFNQALNEDVKTEIRKDDFKYKKKAFRGPASVETEPKPVIKEVPKIDKTIRQIGPNKW